MKFQNRYIKYPFIATAIIVAFKLLTLLLVLISAYKLNKKYDFKYEISWDLYFNLKVKFYLLFIVFMIVNLIIYYLVRRRYIRVAFAKLHLWFSLIALVAIPFAEMLANSIADVSTIPFSLTIGNVTVYDYPFLLSFLLFVIAQVFFLLAMIKSTILQKAELKNDESTGFLNDFT